MNLGNFEGWPSSQTVADPLLPRTGDPSMSKHRASDMPKLPGDSFAHPDGTVYQRVDPDQFALFDEVDSTTIEDPDAG